MLGKLDRVTFTGADDSTDPQDLVEISQSYPFVEWGILFSKTQQGNPRYPSEAWLKMFPMVAGGHLKLSAHLCGQWVRNFVTEAALSWWANYPIPLTTLFQRVQLNFHGRFHAASPRLIGAASALPSTQFILQCDGVNDRPAAEICKSSPNFSPLFDLSGGAGVAPKFIKSAWEHTYCGWAGGIGPDNVRTELERIVPATAGQPFWIDMETRVRSEDDSKFDLYKVIAVLEQIVEMKSA